MEQLNVTNPLGTFGFYMAGSETTVEVLECTVKKCRLPGMAVYDGATVVATRCEFMENGNWVGTGWIE